MRAIFRAFHYDAQVAIAPFSRVAELSQRNK